VLRVVERYDSFQGEGPNTGKPTMFVRFAGCNFKCAGWACDTQHAIDPKLFTVTQQVLDPQVLIDRILADSSAGGVNNICFTGGEPFLQRHDELLEVWSALKARDRTIEVFTNGSLAWPNVDLVDNIILDWKLPGSGEFPDDNFLLTNVGKLGENDAIKFTIKNRADFDRAMDNYQVVRQMYEVLGRPSPQIWCGPVWGALTAEKVARWILAAGLRWHLNVQTHKFIFGADTQGV